MYGGHAHLFHDRPALPRAALGDRPRAGQRERLGVLRERREWTPWEVQACWISWDGFEWHTCKSFKYVSKEHELDGPTTRLRARTAEFDDDEEEERRGRPKSEAKAAPKAEAEAAKVEEKKGGGKKEDGKKGGKKEEKKKKKGEASSARRSRERSA